MTALWSFSYHRNMSEYFPEPFEGFDGDITVKLDLSNYATKADLKGATELIRLI